MAGKNTDQQEYIEGAINKTQDFIKQWLQFERMYRDAHHKLNITPDTEKRFIQVKSHCARIHEYLLGMLDQNYIGGERITEILRRTVTLKQMSMTRDDNYFNIQNDWHVRYLHLQETLANLQYQQEQMAK